MSTTTTLHGTSEQLTALFGALATAQSQFETAEKRAKVSFKTGRGPVEYMYAPLAAIVEATQPALSANGLALLQPFCGGMTDGEAEIVTILTHSGGAHIISTLKFSPNGDIKELGGQTTYLRRYARQCMLGIEAEETTEERDTAEQPPVAREKPTLDPDVRAYLNTVTSALGLKTSHIQQISTVLHGVKVPDLAGDVAKQRSLCDLLQAFSVEDAAAIANGGDVTAVVGAVKDRMTA